jgi:hypothetical protein
MFIQIFSALFIGGFVTLVVIGHIALLHALFIRSTGDIHRPDAEPPPLEPSSLGALSRTHSPCIHPLQPLRSWRWCGQAADTRRVISAA